MKNGANWCLLTTLHFVHNEFISLNHEALCRKSQGRQKICTRCSAHWLHSNCAKNQVPIHEFRGTVRLNVALHYFLQKSGHQHRAQGKKWSFALLCKNNVSWSYFHDCYNSILCFSSTGCLHAIPCKWSVHHGGFGLKFSFLHGWIGLYYLG